MLKGLSWINFILGLWLIVAPFALHFRDVSAAMWNSVILGIVIAVLSIIRALESSDITSMHQQHHGV